MAECTPVGLDRISARPSSDTYYCVRTSTLARTDAFSHDNCRNNRRILIRRVVAARTFSSGDLSPMCRLAHSQYGRTGHHRLGVPSPTLPRIDEAPSRAPHVFRGIFGCGFARDRVGIGRAAKPERPDRQLAHAGIRVVRRPLPERFATTFRLYERNGCNRPKSLLEIVDGQCLQHVPTVAQFADFILDHQGREPGLGPTP
jgi:hypothetical protein